MGEPVPARIVFMGTPRFAEVILSGLMGKGYKPLSIFTREDKTGGRGHRELVSPVKALAIANGIEVIQPKKLRDPAIADHLKNLQTDFIVVAAYGKILPKEVLEIPKYCCLNVHASLLPRWRGASPIQHAILAGDQATGVTIMKMDEGLDTGPVFLRSEDIPVERSDNSGTLTGKLATAGAALITEAIERIVREGIEPSPQDDSLATFAPRIKKEDGLISFEKSAGEIELMVRAFDPWPRAHFFVEGERINVIEAEPGPETAGKEPGEVLPSVKLLVATGGSSSIYLNRVQREGKKPLPSEEFLRGFRIGPGRRI